MSQTSIFRNMFGEKPARPANMIRPRVLRHPRAMQEPLAQNHLHGFAAQYALCLYPAEAIFTFIPKNACSTMRYSLALANGAIAGPEDFLWIHANNPTFKASLGDLARAKYSFVMLRDPFTRLVSCYLDRIASLRHPAWVFHNQTGQGTEPASLTFRGFVRGLAHCLRKDEHWWPQKDFLIYEEYDDYFCVEDFGTAVSTLRARIGFEVQDARGLSRHGTDQYERLDDGQHHADTPAHEIARLQRAGVVPHAGQFYDKDIVRQAGALYAEDIALYRRVTGRDCMFAPEG